MTSNTILTQQKNNDKNIIQYGRFYLNQGYSIIPVDSRNKKGSIISSWKKYQNKKAEFSQIQKWFNRWPQAGVAIVTGKISNIIVLDIDPRHDGDKTIKGKALPPTVTVKSGGGGTHYYYRYPSDLNHISNFDGNNDNINLPGVDLRADGGFVYAPPSTHESGKKYKFYDGMDPKNQKLADPPEWLIEVIQNHEEEKGDPVGPEEFEETIKKGNRNNQLTRLAGSLIHKMNPGMVLTTLKQINKENCEKPLPEREIKKIVESISKRENTKDKSDKSQSDNMKFRPTPIAKEVIETAEQNGNRWEYVAEQGIFYHYDNKKGYWEQYNEKYLMGTIREKLVNINPDWDRKYRKNEVLDALKDLLMNPTNERKFDAGINPDTDLINVKNGMINWKAGELKDHHPDYYSQFQLNVKYDSGARAPKWKQTLKEWIPEKETRDFIQEYIGYCLIPDTSHHKAVILTGSGSNGKSTFLEVITELFSEENLSNIPLHRLSERFETANIQNKLVNICSDISPKYIEEAGILKTMIAGENLRGEYKYGESFDFRPVVRLLFSANEIPKARDKSDAWLRRLELVEFPNQFRKDDPDFDPHLKDKLVKELDGIFNWALEGLRRLQEQGRFTTSEDMVQAKREYERENDTIKAFIEDRTEWGTESYEVCQYVYEKYKDYCQDSGMNFTTRKTFTSKLKKLGVEVKQKRINGKNNRCYYGFSLK